MRLQPPAATLTVLVPAAAGALPVMAFVASTIQSRPPRGGVITDGTAAAVDRRTSRVRGDDGPPRQRITYAPVVELVDAQGATHEVTTGVRGGTRPQAGSAHRVSYLPSDLSRPRLLGDRQQALGRRRSARLPGHPSFRDSDATAARVGTFTRPRSTRCSRAA